MAGGSDQSVAANFIPVRLSDGTAFYTASGGGGGAPYGATPLGFQAITPVAATALTVPATATFAVVQCDVANVRWRDDGVNPTATVGMILFSGTQWTFSGDLSVVKFIQTADGAGTLNVSYYK